MIKSRYFANQEFTTKEDLFAEMRKSYPDLISFKKADIQKSCDKGVSITCHVLKATDNIKALKIDPAYYYIAVNSTWVLDSHEDLHVDGIWNKSVKEQQGQNYLVCDHELTIEDTVVRKEYIEMLIVDMPFALLGRPYNGDTQVLVYKFPKDKVIHSKAKDWLESGDAIEASVRMQYVTILFAMDSNDPEDVTLKKNYDNYIDKIANKDDFEYIPYFFVIVEAKNVRESSLVIAGSNPVTGNLKDNEPSKDTPENKIIKTEPAESSSRKSNFYNLIH
jgi:hypothetical protein